MLKVLITLVAVVWVLIVVLVPIFSTPDYIARTEALGLADSAQAVLLCAVATLAAAIAISRAADRKFLLSVFLAALLLRMIVGFAIFISNAQAFFGGDAFTYDWFAYMQSLGWAGDHSSQEVAMTFIGKGGSGWGMVYLVAAIYHVLGRNMLATQLLNAVLGATTAPIIFLSAWEVFKNIRVARLAAYAVAFMPSLVLWSAQGLKDGPIMFLLALSILATLKVRERFSVTWLAVLIATLLGVLAFRFYVFYMLVAAIGGALLIGTRAFNALSLVRQFVLLVVLGLTMTLFGSIMGARSNLERYGSLKQLQTSRSDAANSANSGYGKDADVSTTRGAVSAIPEGLAYLLLAPFPWQLGSPRQAITMPEMIVWWTTFPILALGLWFSVRHRFRKALPILIFTIMLTLAYSVFQGNLGNAYRQRAQLLIFYFIFTAAGCVQLLERKNANKAQLINAEGSVTSCNDYRQF
jgi:hypothetical protein